jgi:NhaP-type Na+/H+ or K+/H+ antiporter
MVTKQKLTPLQVFDGVLQGMLYIMMVFVMISMFFLQDGFFAIREFVATNILFWGSIKFINRYGLKKR